MMKKYWERQWHIIVKIYFLLFVILLVGCSFDYEKGDIADTLDTTQPDIVLENARLVFIRGTKVIINADRIEIFSKQQQQNMFNVKFIEEDRNKNIRMEGRADQIAIETDNNNVTMTGNIRTRSYNDEAEIYTEYLYWDDKAKVMNGSNVYPIEIKKDIGSTITGYGFYGDAEKRTLTLRGKTSGELVVDE